MYRGFSITEELHRAVLYRNLHKIKILLPLEKSINQKNKNGYSVLLLACEQDNEEVLDLILTRDDIDINVCNKEKLQALHILAFRGNLVGIQKIFDKFPTVNIDAVNEKYNTPLVMAAKMDHAEVIEYLAAKGANVNHKTDKEFTALHYAANNGYTRSMKVLIKLGANVNARDNYGLTPLMKTCKWGFIETCFILVKNRADVNLNSKNVTALQSACVGNNVKVLNFLISNGANVNYPGPYSSALIECARRGSVECAEELIRAGANVHGRSTNGKTALDFAKTFNHKGMVELLQKYFM